MEEGVLVAELRKHRFYQQIDLGGGIVTPGLPMSGKQKLIVRMIEAMDLRNKRVLDVGTANGLYALALERSGADEVIALDHTAKNIEVLERIILPRFKSSIKPYYGNILNMNADTIGTFDVVIFAGVLYHLRYPFTALRVMRELVKPGGTMILETGIYLGLSPRAALYCPSPDDTPKKVRFANECSFFNRKALLELLGQFGFHIESVTYPRPFLRRLAARIAGAMLLHYPVVPIVVVARRDDALVHARRTEFYESVTA